MMRNQIFPVCGGIVLIPTNRMSEVSRLFVSRNARFRKSFAEFRGVSQILEFYGGPGVVKFQYPVVVVN